MPYEHILVDDPRPRVRRITLNRPEKRNALNNRLRAEVFEVLEQADRDPEVSISIVRGAGPCFSAGYDLSADNRVDQPYHSASGPGQWSRHVVEGWFSIWDLAKPVVAQVHGYCLAGGTELATACDIVYVADDAEIGYPPVPADEPARHAVSPLAGRHAPRHGADADGRCDVRPRGRRMGLCDAFVSA
jgi:enoyl-CoA hydratase